MTKKGFSATKPILSIESVIPLTDEEIESVVKNLGLNSVDITVTNTKNPGLVAGIRVSYQGQVIDMSLNYQLNQLKV
jgi:F0F1-type ATP synthase delta subunit